MTDSPSYLNDYAAYRSTKVKSDITLGDIIDCVGKYQSTPVKFINRIKRLVQNKGWISTENAAKLMGEVNLQKLDNIQRLGEDILFKMNPVYDKVPKRKIAVLSTEREIGKLNHIREEILSINELIRPTFKSLLEKKLSFLDNYDKTIIIKTQLYKTWIEEHFNINTTSPGPLAFKEYLKEKILAGTLTDKDLARFEKILRGKFKYNESIIVKSYNINDLPNTVPSAPVSSKSVESLTEGAQRKNLRKATFTNLEDNKYINQNNLSEAFATAFWETWQTTKHNRPDIIYSNDPVVYSYVSRTFDTELQNFTRWCESQLKNSQLPDIATALKSFSTNLQSQIFENNVYREEYSQEMFADIAGYHVGQDTGDAAPDFDINLPQLQELVNDYNSKAWNKSEVRTVSIPHIFEIDKNNEVHTGKETTAMQEVLDSINEIFEENSPAMRVLKIYSKQISNKYDSK